MSKDEPFDYCNLTDIKEAIKFIEQGDTMNKAIQECLRMLKSAIGEN